MKICMTNEDRLKHIVGLPALLKPWTGVKIWVYICPSNLALAYVTALQSTVVNFDLPIL